jgi:hypothetical protein
MIVQAISTTLPETSEWKNRLNIAADRDDSVMYTDPSSRVD